MSSDRRLSVLTSRLPGPENPTVGHRYLDNANYYRLGYQLAAQLVNRSVAEASSEKGVNEEASQIAQRFLSAAREVRCWYDQRERVPWWNVWIVGPDAQEKRLRRFLLNTIEPCLELLVAAAVHARDPDDAGWRAEMVRDRAEMEKLSYRALYSLACYEADIGSGLGPELEHGESWSDRALGYLRAAFRMTPGPYRRELARWAKRDPSLASLASRSEFHDLLAVFE